MAIGLSQANQRTRILNRQANQQRELPKEVVRPWQSEIKNLDFQELSDRNITFLPDHIESLDNVDLLQITTQNWLAETWHDLQSKSYWLSRLTHKSSWLARVQLKQKIRIPLPSWLTQKSF